MTNLVRKFFVNTVQRQFGKTFGRFGVELSRLQVGRVDRDYRQKYQSATNSHPARIATTPAVLSVKQPTPAPEPVFFHFSLRLLPRRVLHRKRIHLDRRLTMYSRGANDSEGFRLSARLVGPIRV